jgi:hypothetical protein
MNKTLQAISNYLKKQGIEHTQHIDTELLKIPDYLRIPLHQNRPDKIRYLTIHQDTLSNTIVINGYPGTNSHAEIDNSYIFLTISSHGVVEGINQIEIDLANPQLLPKILKALQ